MYCGSTVTPLLAQSLHESVDSALHRSPSVQRTIQEAKMAVADISLARAAQRPSLSVEGSVGMASSTRTVDGIPTANGDWLVHRRASFTLQQLIFDFGASGRLVDAARLRKLYGELIVAETLEDQAGLVVSTYVDILRYRLQARLLVEKINTLEQYGGKAADRAAKEGDVDLVIIKGRLAGARADLAQMEARVGASEKRFQQLTLLEPKNLHLPELPSMDAGYVDTDENAKVQAAKMAVDSGKKNVEALRRDLYPKLFMEVQGAKGKDVMGTEGPDQSLSALAVLRWDVFDGGRKVATLRKAEAEVGKQNAVVDEVRLAIDDDVNRAVEELRGAKKRYRQLSSSIDELTTGVAKTESLLDKGDKSVRLMSLVSAYTEQSNARRDLVDACMDRYKAAFAVLAAGGQLVNYLKVDFEGGRTKQAFK